MQIFEVIVSNNFNLKHDLKECSKHDLILQMKCKKDDDEPYCLTKKN